MVFIYLFAMSKVKVTRVDKMAATQCTESKFATINTDEFQKLIQSKDAISTQKSTEVGVNVFRAYLKEKELDPNFESYSKDRLAEVLQKFYVEVRRAFCIWNFDLNLKMFEIG